MQTKIQDAKRVVVKVGTSTLTYENGKINFRSIDNLARALSDLKNQGKEVVLVSSGAIGVGVGKLGLAHRPVETREKQASAAVGQCELMNLYEKSFATYGHTVAQILITKEDIDVPQRRENAVNTFESLIDWNVIPIVNENDTIAVEEIVFGDNDSLSAVVASIIHADLLILLTDIDGLYDKNPAEFSDAKKLDTVTEISEDILQMAGGSGSNRGTGGMVTKLHAAEIALAHHMDMVIASGKEPHVSIYDIFDGKQVGTHFIAKGE